MARESINYSNFASGEYSRHLSGNFTNDSYITGLARAENIIVQPEGGWVRSSGNKLLGSFTANSRTISFYLENNVTFNVVLEPTGQVSIIAPSGAVQSFTPLDQNSSNWFTPSVIKELDFAQVRDTIIFTHITKQPLLIKLSFDMVGVNPEYIKVYRDTGDQSLRSIRVYFTDETFPDEATNSDFLTLSGVPDVTDAWRITEASYSSNFLSIGGVFKKAKFSPDGTKLFTLNSAEVLTEYNLSTAWDIATAVASGATFDLSTQDSSMESFTFSEDGKALIAVGSNTDSLYQYSLSTGYSVATMSYANKSFSVSGQDSIPVDVELVANGTRLFMLGSFNDRIYQYNLTSSADLDTISYASSFHNITSQDSIPRGIAVQPDGTKLYMVGANTDTVYEYLMPTPFTVSSLDYSGQSFSVNSQDSSPYSIAFKPDGTKMFVGGQSTNNLYEYDIPDTNWGFDLNGTWDIAATSTGTNSITLISSSLTSTETENIVSPDIQATSGLEAELYVAEDGPWEEKNTDPRFKIRAGNGFTAIGDGFEGTDDLIAVDKTDNTRNDFFLDIWATQKRQVRLEQRSGGTVQVAVLQINSVSSAAPGEFAARFNATVLDGYALLQEGLGSHTKNWRLSSWYEGAYPDTVAFHQNRLWFFRGGKRWATVSGDLFRFSPDFPDIDDASLVVRADSGIAIEGVEGVSQSARWAATYQGLQVGNALSGELIGAGGNREALLTPETATIQNQHAIGSAKIKPVIGKFLYFIDSTTTGLYQLRYEFRLGGFTADLVGDNREILQDGVVSMEYIEYPFKMIWLTLNSGNIAVCSINGDETSFSWSRIVLPNGLKAQYVSKFIYNAEFEGKESIVVTTRDGKVLSFGDLYPRSDIDYTKSSSLSYAPYSKLISVAPNEFLLSEAVTYEAGTTFDVSTLSDDQVLIDLGTYEVFDNNSDIGGGTIFTGTNRYQVGIPFYSFVRFRPLDQVSTQNSRIKDTKMVKRAFYSLVDSANFSIGVVGETPKEVSVKPTPSDSLYTGVFEDDSLNTDADSLIEIEVTQTLPTPLQMNGIYFDTEIQTV